MKYLEITISLVFIFLMLSLFSSIIMEFISTFFRMRASTLQQTIAKMLGANSIKEENVKKFYETPIIKMLGEQTTAFFGNINANNLPHTIDSKTFATTLLFISKNPLNKEENEGQKVNYTDNLTEDIIDKSMLGQDGKTYLKYLLSKVNDKYKDLEKDKEKDELKKITAAKYEELKKEIEIWYDMMIERTITWYKRKTQYILIIIGILLAVIFNADSIRIITELNKNDKARMEIVKAATEYVKANDSLKLNTLTTNIYSLHLNIIEEYNNALSQTYNILGWENKIVVKCPEKKDCLKIFISVIGYILTGFAISLGSNFWFDMLKKITNIKVLANQDN
jgi:hypothetical protein